MAEDDIASFRKISVLPSELPSEFGGRQPVGGVTGCQKNEKVIFYI
jgi:hypothetical protein